VKRHPALVPLSDDHHGALVLARRLRRAAGAPDADALAEETRAKFDRELEPHFRVEEERLLPALAARGAADLVDAIARDHARLRELVRRPWSAETPGELGALLERHVRFEERVAFPRAEALLSERELASVCDAAGSDAAGATEKTSPAD
jgi:hypothetical protein